MSSTKGKTNFHSNAHKMAEDANKKGLADYAANPAAFMVVTMKKDVGVPTKGISRDYVLTVSVAAGDFEVVLPKDFLTKKGKIALEQMKIGARLITQGKTVVTSRNWYVAETVVAVLP